MALRGRAHATLTAALSAALVPATVAHVLLGAVVGIAWMIVRRPRLAITGRLLVPVAGVACVIAAHPTDLGTAVLRWAGLVLAIIAGHAFQAGLDGKRPAAVGIAAAGTAVVLAAWAAIAGLVGGFGQVHPATHHPNLSAAVGLALIGASALAARRDGRSGRALANVGGIAGVILVAFTGSRSGLVGLAFAVLGLGVVALAKRVIGGPTRAAAVVMTVGIAATSTLQIALFEPAALGIARPTGAIVTSGTTVDPGAQATLTARARSLLNPWLGTGARIANWRVGRELAAERPLLGFGFDDAVTSYRAATSAQLMVANDHPHNSSLLLLLQGGTVLLVSIVAASLAFAWSLSRRAVAGDATASRVLAAGFGLVAADRFDLVLAEPTVAVVLLISVFAALQGAAPATPRATKEHA